MSLISFGSDNHSGVHPELMQEMLAVNEAFAPSYEQDQWSQQLRKELLTQFDACDAALVFNGTAANVLSLQVGLESFEAVLCTDVSHLNVDECGAPEKIAGVKLIPLPSTHGKPSLADIEKAIVRRGDQHFSQIKMISITQPTEYGTLYTLNELEELRTICDRNKLYLHIDGARLANAAVALDCDFKTLTACADLVSFGGAKNGLMMGEFVIVRNPNLKKGLKFFRKQSLQLPSKTRFLSAPFLKYISTPLWKDIARHENQLAQLLRRRLNEISYVEMTQPTEANSVFCKIPQPMIKKMRQKYFFYVWDETTFEVRLMTSFATTESHIEDFISTLTEQEKP